ncbi:MAG TPA: EpsI family protein [Burkholderiales bacterium]|nr:EpsI family protein [Burkholderiales bacterium]
MNRFRKLVVTQIVLLAGLATIYALPRTYESRPSAILMSLPTFVGDWYGKSLEVPERVELSLAKDTAFDQKEYRRFAPGFPGDFDTLLSFIVLSGDDMNNSIHRPERCLAAQGYTIHDRGEVTIDLGDGRTLKAMRLHSSRPIMDSTRRISHITYYWFTGATALTNSHYRRTWIDMRDRLFTGTNQRWAFVTVAANYGDGRGEHIAVRSEGETDAILTDFTRQLFDRIHKPVELDGLD